MQGSGYIILVTTIYIYYALWVTLAETVERKTK